MTYKNILFLDIGSFTLKGLLVSKKNSAVLAKATIECSGICEGYVVDSIKFMESVKFVIDSVEKSSKNRVCAVVLLVGASLIEYKMISTGNIKLGAKFDSQKLDSINAGIKKWASSRDYWVIKAIPIQYKLDGILVKNPQNMYANQISCNFFVAYAKSNQLGNLVFLLEELGLDVIDIVPTIYACVDSHLNRDERILGSLIFDFGAASIDWAFVVEDNIVSAGAIRLGGEIITNKIAKSFSVSLSEARRIKHNHAAAALEPKNFCSWVEIFREVGMESVVESEVIRKILPEIDLLSNKILKIVKSFESKASCIVFCGAASWLNGFVDLLSKKIILPTRISPSSDPSFDAISGFKDHQYFTSQKSANFLGKCISWLKNNL